MGKNKSGKRPPVWQMVKEAVASMNGEASYKEIKEYIWQHYGDVKERTINCQIIICSVNQKSRVYYPANRKPRNCNTKYDFLYTLGNGRVTFYNPKEHGVWGIVEAGDKLVVKRLDGAEADEKPVAARTARKQYEAAPAASPLIKKVEDEQNYISGSFPQVREVLYNNLSLVGKNLRIYTDASGRQGFEYPTEVGIIDILATDPHQRLTVMEFAEEVTPEVLSRVLAYMGWVRRNLSPGKEVKGMIFTNRIEEHMLLSVSQIPGIEVYQLKMSLEVNKMSA
ncbi:MAG: hypothetical protein GXY92_08940 [Syntrophomonadaceae bacterium]|nr:hypothetical protein [Syntrophomonadaceae bacterium]